MEKESVKKFDLEAAFKALDEIETPETHGLTANRVDLKERFSHKPGTDTLVEDYYDVMDREDLGEAKEERDNEIAQAKLARIEKIVDLDADSPEDLLPSYVGKVIVQCPQCMTLFYKNPEDIEKSEENPDVVNVNEICQHCGNASGYTVIGKVDSVQPDETGDYQAEETPAEENELNLDFDTEAAPAEETTPAEETSEEPAAEEADADLDLKEIPEDETEEKEKEEKKEESLNLSKETSENETEHKSENLTLNEESEPDACSIDSEAQAAETNEADKENNEAALDAFAAKLTEDVDKDLDKKIKDHNDYIEYIRSEIAKEEEAAEKTDNKEVKDLIQKRIESLQADLEAALPDALKGEPEVQETPVVNEEPSEEASAEESAETEAPVDESLNKSEAAASEHETEHKSENNTLCEATSKDADANPDLKATDGYIIQAGDKHAKIIRTGRFHGKPKEIKQMAQEFLDTTPDVANVFVSRRYQNIKTGEEVVIALDSYTLHKGGDIETTDEALTPREVAQKLDDAEASLQAESLTESPTVSPELDEFVKNLPESLTESPDIAAALDEYIKSLPESLEEAKAGDLDVSDAEFKKMVDSVTFNEDLPPESFTRQIADEIEHAGEDIPDEPAAEDETKTEEALTETYADAYSKMDRFMTDEPEAMDKFYKITNAEDMAEFLEDNIQNEDEFYDRAGKTATIKGFAEYIIKNKLNTESLKEAAEAETDEAAEETPTEEPAETEEPATEEAPSEETPVETTIGEVKDIAKEAVEKSFEESSQDDTQEEIEAKIDEVVDEVVEKNLGEAASDETTEEPEAAEDSESEFEFSEDDIEDLDESSMNEHIGGYLTEVYSNVKSFVTEGCRFADGKLFVEGCINFASGKSKKTVFEFMPAHNEGKLFFEGCNKDFAEGKAFKLGCSIDESKKLVVESVGYSYSIGETLVEGLK